ncbi:FAD:protein FMN transferase [Asticcacaulis sp. 201]|uniref:FAD:protein FMN transferase n=1 Tax=Asticcacaulis sp. 201 TaxID=3028787 RepID=UPI002915D83C|nr:FAD:protein FMN transferase [Asticcacaulis sp. 201]MDV6330253.1 FAD:protein FMN transferase [Asticcacaulis sp. 201]
MQTAATAYDRRVLVPDLDAVPPRPDGATGYALSGRAFATGWSVRLYADAAPQGLTERIQARLDDIDREMSPYRVDSDLTRFNLTPAGQFVALPPRVMTVVADALDMAALTEGAFDPAILPAVELWGFGAKTVAPGVPDPAEIAALKPGGWRELAWRADGMIKPSEVRIDLCAIAKGFAVDEVLRLVQSELGVRSALVEIGGELAGWGVQADGQPWWIDIETPSGKRTVAALCGGAVATSGEVIRHFSHGGQLYSHTIDGATQSPTRSDVVSATVFDPACWRADAVATALTVMGGTRALAFATQHDIPCLLSLREGATVRDCLSPALEAWL